MMAGHAPVQWHQRTMGDWKRTASPTTAYGCMRSRACARGAQGGLSYSGRNLLCLLDRYQVIDGLLPQDRSCDSRNLYKGKTSLP